MSTNELSSVMSSLEKWVPNEARKGNGTSQSKKRKTVEERSQITSEATLEPDAARNEADKRRQELQEQQLNPKGKGGQTVVQHRQITPESTPGPDNARNEADKQRQQEEEQTTGNDDGGFTETRPPHSFELDGEGDTLKGSSKGTEVVKAKASKGKELVKDTLRGSNETEVIKTKASKGKELVKDTSEGSKEARVSIAQREAVDRVLKAPDGWNFQILGLKGLQDAEKVSSAYKKLALQVHPDRNRDLRAGSAFQKIQNAVEALGVEVPLAEEFINHNRREIDRDGNVIENELEDIEMTSAAEGQTGASQAGASQAGASQTEASQTRGQPVASADIEYS